MNTERHGHKYEDMFPEEFDREFKKSPIAYVSCGGLEIHGAHNALGIDGYLGYHLALQSAKLSGGIVMPPLFIACAGIPQLDWNTLKTTALDLGRPGVWHGREVLVEIMKQTVWNLEKIGFKVCVIIPGHWPNYFAMKEYGASIQHRQGNMAVEVVDLLDKDCYKYIKKGHESHGAVWESSLFQYFRPDLVDPARLKNEDSALCKTHAPISNPDDIRPETAAPYVAAVCRAIADKALKLLKATGSASP